DLLKLPYPSPLPHGAIPVTDPPRQSTSSDTSTEELSPALLGAIQHIVTAAIGEQAAAIAPARVATPSNADAPEEEAGGDVPVLVPLAGKRQEIPYQRSKKSLHSGLPASSTLKWPTGYEVPDGGSPRRRTTERSFHQSGNDR
ncbi:UNVERIFIED_CONTAM: hypothetical protein Slati_3911400, partial [Sesamum latifolium]